jgi:adenylate cyclase
MKRRLAANPYLPIWCVEGRGVALYVQDRHREAIEQLSALPFQTKRSRLYQIAARIALGEIDQAQKLARTALALQPDLTTQYVREQEWYRDEAVLEELVRRLIRAGVSDRS